jgi:C4-dicarboxylate transporter DctQ subunit
LRCTTILECFGGEEQATAGKLFVRLLDALIYLSALLGGLFILITAFLVGFEVVMRYVFDSPTLWSFDVTIFLIIYAVFLGSAFTLREGKHVKVAFFSDWFSKFRLPSAVLNIVCNIVAILFWLLVALTTFRDATTAYQFHEVTQSYLRFPLIIPLIAVILGGVLILIQLLIDTMTLLVSIRRRPA